MDLALCMVCSIAWKMLAIVAATITAIIATFFSGSLVLIINVLTYYNRLQPFKGYNLFKGTELLALI